MANIEEITEQVEKNPHYSAFSRSEFYSVMNEEWTPFREIRIQIDKKRIARGVMPIDIGIDSERGLIANILRIMCLGQTEKARCELENMTDPQIAHVKKTTYGELLDTGVRSDNFVDKLKNDLAELEKRIIQGNRSLLSMILAPVLNRDEKRTIKLMRGILIRERRDLMVALTPVGMEHKRKMEEQKTSGNSQ